MGSGKGKRKRARRDAVFESRESEDEDEMEGGNEGMEVDGDTLTGAGRSKHDPIVVIDASLPAPDPLPDRSNGTHISDVGSALKRNADGSVVTPRVVKRPKKDKMVCHLSPGFCSPLIFVWQGCFPELEAQHEDGDSSNAVRGIRYFIRQFRFRQ